MNFCCNVVRFRCARCDSTEEDGVDGAVPPFSQQLIDYGHADHPHQPGADCFCSLPLDVASNGYLININDDDDSVNR